MRTHYENLEVSPHAQDAVIRASYRVLVQKYHPDRFQPQSEAERITKLLNQAYAILSDPEKRRIYDEVLATAAAKGARDNLNSEAATPQEPTEKQEPTAEAPGASMQPASSRRRRHGEILVWLAMGAFVAYGFFAPSPPTITAPLQHPSTPPVGDANGEPSSPSPTLVRPMSAIPDASTPATSAQLPNGQTGPATIQGSHVVTTQAGFGQPDLSTLSRSEVQSIETACFVSKSEGPASYNRCLQDQMRQLQSAPGQPDLRQRP